MARENLPPSPLSSHIGAKYVTLKTGAYWASDLARAVKLAIVLEDQIYKAIALGAPCVQAICMGRSTLTAAMVGKTQAQRLEESCGRGEGYHEALLRTFTGAAELLDKYIEAFEQISPASIAVYTYYDRLSAGLRQLMAGASSTSSASARTTSLP